MEYCFINNGNNRYQKLLELGTSPTMAIENQEKSA